MHEPSELQKQAVETQPEKKSIQETIQSLLKLDAEQLALELQKLGPLDIADIREAVTIMALESNLQFSARQSRTDDGRNAFLIEQRKLADLTDALTARLSELHREWEAATPIADPKDDLQVLLRRVQAGENAVKLVQELDAKQCTKFMPVLGGFIAVRKAIHQMGNTGILDAAISTETANTLYTELNRHNWHLSREESPH